MRAGVVALGNVLMGDDAFGPWVVETLVACYDFPAGVTVEDLGTPGLDLWPYLSDLDALILVDTVRSSAAPGTLRLFRKDELLRHAPETRLGPHDPGVKQALLTAEFAGCGPRDVLLVGAVPEQARMGVQLSPALRQAVAPAVAEVLRELARLGRPAVRRARSPACEPWWESAPGVTGA